MIYIVPYALLYQVICASSYGRPLKILHKAVSIAQLRNNDLGGNQRAHFSLRYKI